MYAETRMPLMRYKTFGVFTLKVVSRRLRGGLAETDLVCGYYGHNHFDLRVPDVLHQQPDTHPLF